MGWVRTLCRACPCGFFVERPIQERLVQRFPSAHSQKPPCRPAYRVSFRAPGNANEGGNGQASENPPRLGGVGRHCSDPGGLGTGPIDLCDLWQDEFPVGSHCRYTNLSARKRLDDSRRCETLAVLGRSRHGKSVLLKVIIGLQPADAGS